MGEAVGRGLRLMAALGATVFSDLPVFRRKLQLHILRVHHTTQQHRYTNCACVEQHACTPESGLGEREATQQASQGTLPSTGQ